MRSIIINNFLHCARILGNARSALGPRSVDGNDRQPQKQSVHGQAFNGGFPRLVRLASAVERFALWNRQRTGQRRDTTDLR
jgi:hypothetical protein